MKRTLVVDLDGTLTVDRKGVPYPDKDLDGDVARAVAAARESGWGVQIMTARGMRTYNHDRALVEQHVRPSVAAWLALREVAHDQLHVGKPWCGPGGFYLDDRNLHLEEAVARFTGPYAGLRVAVRVSGVVGDPVAVHRHLTRLDRWLEVVSFDYDHVARDGGDVALDDERVGADVPFDWTLWCRPPGPAAGPAAWFAAWAERLTEPLPVGHAGGDAIAAFALVPGELTFAQAFALADLR